MKYLDKINSPKDLRSIPKEELGEVCKELRTYITDTINEIGGHLAPTLGAVEITTAVHYVCLLYTSPSPRDAHESRMPSSA